MPWLYGESNIEKQGSSATQEDAWVNYSKASAIYTAAIASGNKDMTMDKAFAEA
jgi:hypothetical protein